MFSSLRLAQLGLVGVATVLLFCLWVLGNSAFHHRVERLSAAPEFTLVDTTGQRINLHAMRGRIVVLVFSSVRSPASNQYCERIAELASRFAVTGRVAVLNVDSSVADDDPRAADEILLHQRITGLTVPTLIDRGGRIASAYGITRTPTVCVVDDRGTIRYRGDIDDQPNPQLVHQRFCEDAVINLLSQQPS